MTPPTMPNSKRWSTASAPCRLDWRPSRWVVLGLQALGPLGAVSLLASEIPGPFAWPLALLALGYGLCLARREAGLPVCRFVWSGDGRVLHDGEALEEMSVHWRGPLAFMTFRMAGGRARRLGWWPDTLDSRERRELRLAVECHAASRRAPRMAG
jgi:toxin CptA